MTQDAPVKWRAVEAARYLRVSRSTLAKWRMNGMGPPFHRCGPRLVYYYKHENRRLARRVRSPDGDCGALSAMSAEARISEPAEILAAGLMCLLAPKSSPNSADAGECSLDLSPAQSGHPCPVKRRETDG